MSLPFDKKFQEISISDIQSLISGSVTEGQNLEFKKEVWNRSDDAIREMLRDISSLANAYGGYIVVGVEDNSDGQAIACHAVPNAEEERDRIFSSCIANLEPRIIGLDIKTLPINESENVFLIRVPNSFNLHQITFKGLYQFWKRHDRQEARMSIDEIKDAILKNESSGTNTEKFLKDRHELRRRLGRSLILSAMPIKAEKELFLISDMALREILKDSTNERYGGWNFNFKYSMARPSLNGLHVGAEREGKTLDFFRNGYLEGYIQINEGHIYLNKLLRYGDKPEEEMLVFRNIAVVELIYSFTKRLKALLDYVHYDGPYIFSIGMYNIQEMVLPKFRPGAMFEYHEFEVWKDGDLIIGPEVFEDINSEKITKYFSDRIWQAFGFEQEPFFSDGKFKFDQ